MLALGIHDGHTATACLMEDGAVVACVSEERIVRDKERSGFPAEAVKECLRLAGREAGDVAHVGICSLLPQIGAAGWKKPGLHKRGFGMAVKVLPDRLLQSPGNVRRVQALSSRLFKGRKRALLAHFGSARAVARAGLSDLKAVDGISATLAETIHAFFQQAG